MYMDDIKLFGKKNEKMDILIQTIRIYNQDIEMEFGIEKMCQAYNEKWKKTNY